MTFKDFTDKYLGMIIGIIVAIIIIIVKAIYIVECIALIIGLAWLGKYVQSNKSSVKDSLKSMIDRF